MATSTIPKSHPDPDPEFLKIIQSGPPPPLPSKDPVELRNFTNAQKKAAREAAGLPPVGVQEYDIRIPVRNDATISGRVYAPPETSGSKSPLFLFFHGGGYCIGSSEDESETNRILVLKLGLVIVSVEYRLAPEHRFPTCVYDGLDALNWVVANASSLHANPAVGLIVGGVSSGGNIAQAVVYLNRSCESPLKISGQFLSVANMIPSLVVPEQYRGQYQSMEANKDFSIPPAEIIQVFIEAYQPDVQSPLFVPFNHPKGHRGIPPTYFQICELDGLADEERIYEKVLREEYGIPTRTDTYKGLPHHFWEFFPQLTQHIERRIDDAVEGVKWLLKQKL